MDNSEPFPFHGFTTLEERWVRWLDERVFGAPWLWAPVDDVVGIVLDSITRFAEIGRLDGVGSLCDVGIAGFSLLTVARARPDRDGRLLEPSIRRRVASLAVAGIDTGCVGRFPNMDQPSDVLDFIRFQASSLCELAPGVETSPSCAEEFEMVVEEMTAAVVMMLTLTAGEPDGLVEAV